MNTLCRSLTALAVAILLSGCEEIVRTGLTTMGSSDEESANRLTLDETYDHTRNGARLILVYDTINNAFKGTVENTTAQTLDQVRVEIHLSNGTELGPTTPQDLAPGEKIPVVLQATSTPFTWWVAHPEVGGSGGESGGGETGNEGGGEGGNAGESGGEHGGGAHN